MNVLGLSYGYHDSASALSIDGRLVACSQEDRFTRQKHDPNYPRNAIEYCLESSNLNSDELDLIVFHEDPIEKFSRVLISSFYSYPYSFKEFKNSMKAWLTQKLWVKNHLSRELNVSPKKIKTLDHHFSHACNAFLGSDFEEAGILIIDAVGDWYSTAIYKGAWVNNKPEIKLIKKIKFPNSLGLFYSAITEHLGFNPNDQECNTMALAGFGSPSYLDELKNIISFNEDCSYMLDQSYFNFMKFYSGGLSERFTSKFGDKADPKIFEILNCFEKNNTIDDLNIIKFLNMACSIQNLYEEYVVSCANYITNKISKNICFAGGGALNCVANGKILDNVSVGNFYIPADPGDGGSAVGAALYGNYLGEHQSGKNLKPHHRYLPYLGKKYDPLLDVKWFDKLTPEDLRQYLPDSEKNKISFRVQTFNDTDELCLETANLLFNEKIVGWYQNGSEIGPRALGNRSILIRPDKPELAKKLSQTVKERAFYRPYAFSITDLDASRVIPRELINLDPLKKMQVAVKIKDDIKANLSSCIHIDGTSRPQVTCVDSNPTYFKLLNEYGKISGLSALLNTSFNEKGFPLIDSPLLAIMMFIRTEMNTLVLHNTIIEKVYK